MLNRFQAFTKAVSVSYKCIQKIKKFETDTLGVKGSHVMCLFYLGQSEKGLSATEICKICNMDKAAVSRILPTLQQEGYIYPDIKGEQKYRIKYRLTNEGRKISDALNLLISNVVTRCSRGLTASERENFYSSFDVITKNLAELTNELEQLR